VRHIYRSLWIRSDEAFQILLSVGDIAHCKECRELLLNDMLCDRHEVDKRFERMEKSMTRLLRLAFAAACGVLAAVVGVLVAEYMQPSTVYIRNRKELK
jgi:hypothetical protein